LLFLSFCHFFRNVFVALQAKGILTTTGLRDEKREMFKNCPFHRKIWPSRDCCVFVFVLEFEEKTRHFCQEISAAMTGKSPSQNHKITQNHKRKSEALPFIT